MNIFEYFMNIMNDLMEKETQLHNICNCCLWFVAFWLHAFAGRVAKDSVGGKWKGLRCVHHRLRWPWTKTHWTNFSWNFEFSQSWINLWVSIVRSGRNGQFGEFVLRIFCKMGAVPTKYELAKHFHRCGEDFSVERCSWMCFPNISFHIIPILVDEL